MWLQTEVQKNTDKFEPGKTWSGDVTQVDGGQLQVAVGTYRLNAMPIPAVANPKFPCCVDGLGC